MATVSGGSKPTFTVDQVLHAVEMNQLNQEWIVDSVPAGSAGVVPHPTPGSSPCPGALSAHRWPAHGGLRPGGCPGGPD